MSFSQYESTGGQQKQQHKFPQSQQLFTQQPPMQQQQFPSQEYMQQQQQHQLITICPDIFTEPGKSADPQLSSQQLSLPSTATASVTEPTTTCFGKKEIFSVRLNYDNSFMIPEPVKKIVEDFKELEKEPLSTVNNFDSLDDDFKRSYNEFLREMFSFLCEGMTASDKCSSLYEIFTETGKLRGLLGCTFNNSPKDPDVFRISQNTILIAPTEKREYRCLHSSVDVKSLGASIDDRITVTHFQGNNKKAIIENGDSAEGLGLYKLAFVKDNNLRMFLSKFTGSR